MSPHTFNKNEEKYSVTLSILILFIFMNLYVDNLAWKHTDTHTQNGCIVKFMESKYGSWIVPNVNFFFYIAQ